MFSGEGATTCAARDVSAEGARVAIASDLELPDQVHFIDVLSGVAYPARLVWRSSTEAGLEFDDGLDLAGAQGGRLHRTWREYFTSALRAVDWSREWDEERPTGPPI